MCRYYANTPELACPPLPQWFINASYGWFSERHTYIEGPNCRFRVYSINQMNGSLRAKVEGYDLDTCPFAEAFEEWRRKIHQQPEFYFELTEHRGIWVCRSGFCNENREKVMWIVAPGSTVSDPPTSFLVTFTDPTPS